MVIAVSLEPVRVGLTVLMLNRPRPAVRLLAFRRGWQPMWLCLPPHGFASAEQGWIPMAPTSNDDAPFFVAPGFTQARMMKVFAGALAAVLVAAPAVASADDETAYVLSGAKMTGIDWYGIAQLAGKNYHPNAHRVMVDYPAGMLQGQLPGTFFPGSGLDSTPVGESVAVGANNLDAALREEPGRAVALGLSEGAMVLEAEKARLADNPTAPPREKLSFTLIGPPASHHGFGQSLLTEVFPAGTFVPVLDYRIPSPVESQYHTTVVVAAYDGIADFPDRPSNLLSAVNAFIGLALLHTPTAFTGPADVPPQNVITTTNSRGGTTTTYLVPSKYLPLTLPLRLSGFDDIADQLDPVLRPMVDAGYSRNDNPLTAPTNLDPAAPDPLPVIAGPTGPSDLDGVLRLARDLFPARTG